MKLLEQIHKFPFKNFLAIPLIYGLLWLMANVPSLHDSCVVLLTLVVKYYYDSNTSSAAKDATISKALDTAQMLPGPNQVPNVGTAQNVNINQETKP